MKKIWSILGDQVKILVLNTDQLSVDYCWHDWRLKSLIVLYL